MIKVNENLIGGYSGTHIIEAKNTGKSSDNYNYKEIAIPTDCKENQEYTCCFKAKQFNGSGEFSINLFDKYNKKSAGLTGIKVSNENVYFNFKYRAGITEHLLIYTDISGHTRGVGLELKDIILVKGHFERGGNEIVYLPHKEDVKLENQAIFPIGGGITKSTHSSKFGGALC